MSRTGVIVGCLLLTGQAFAVSPDENAAAKGETASDAATKAEPAPSEPKPLVSVSGYVQADAILSNQRSHDELAASTRAPLNETRFLIRRAHVRFSTEQGFVLGAIELDANTVNGMQSRVVEAVVAARYESRLEDEPVAARATLGLFKIPFGVEVPESDSARLFLERTTASRALFPGNYDLGGKAEGRYGPLSLVIAAMNGNPIQDGFLPAQDPNAAKDVVGRLGVDARVVPRVTVRLGMSALSGTGLSPGTPATKDVLVWRDTNENGRVELSELQSIAGSAAKASQNFSRFALGLDAAVSVDVPWLGAATLAFELASAKNLDRGVEPADPVAIGRDVRELGFHLSGTLEVTRHAMVGVRYDRYDPDLDAAEERGVSFVPTDRSYQTVAFAAALRHGIGRLVLEYDRNDNALGRSRAGAPTTLASDQVALRGQVVF